MSQANWGCSVKPFIPYSGLSKFEFNSSQFPELSVKQKTSRNRGKSISITVSFKKKISFLLYIYFETVFQQSGEATVLEDKSISKVVVEFDLKFNNEGLQDTYWIEKEESATTGLYALTIRVSLSLV